MELEMAILDIIRLDYQNFPKNQHYQLYASNVYFKDPLTEFQGIERYQKMIRFMETWFQDICLDLHDIVQHQDLITTRWTLQWTTPVPWKPLTKISGYSELKLDDYGKICSHIDYWNCSPWQVLGQQIGLGSVF